VSQLTVPFSLAALMVVGEPNESDSQTDQQPGEEDG
jgi:hypothetical protein